MIVVARNFSSRWLAMAMSLPLWICKVQRSTAFNTSPVPLQDELGCSPTLSYLLSQREEKKDFYFDPLGLATDENFARYREAELKHGRVAMVAFVYSWISFLVSPTERTSRITTILSTDQAVQSIGNNNDDVPVGLWAILRHGQVPPIYQQLQEWSPTDIYKLIAICGFLETVVLVQISPTDMPGDYGVGYFGVRDKGKHERSLVSELENGRLVMLVMLYYVFVDIQYESSLYQESINGIFKLL